MYTFINIKDCIYGCWGRIVRIKSAAHAFLWGLFPGIGSLAHELETDGCHHFSGYLIWRCYGLDLLSQFTKAVRIFRPLPVCGNHPFIWVKTRVHEWWQQLTLFCCQHIKPGSTSKYNSPRSETSVVEGRRDLDQHSQGNEGGAHFSHVTKLNSVPVERPCADQREITR